MVQVLLWMFGWMLNNLSLFLEQLTLVVLVNVLLSLSFSLAYLILLFLLHSFVGVCQFLLFYQFLLIFGGCMFLQHLRGVRS